jgi:hypothetical protein
MKPGRSNSVPWAWEEKKGGLTGGARLSVPNLNEGVSRVLGRRIKGNQMAEVLSSSSATWMGALPDGDNGGTRVWTGLTEGAGQRRRVFGEGRRGRGGVAGGRGRVRRQFSAWRRQLLRRFGHLLRQWRSLERLDGDASGQLCAGKRFARVSCGMGACSWRETRPGKTWRGRLPPRSFARELRLSLTPCSEGEKGSASMLESGVGREWSGVRGWEAWGGAFIAAGDDWCLMAPEKSWCLVECPARWEPQEEGVMNIAARFSLS